MSQLEANANTYTTKLLKRRWLSKKTFEIELSRPPSFSFKPGQRICVKHHGKERDYSMVSTPADTEISLCIRNVAGGILSRILSTADIGTRFSFTGPHGYFTFKSSRRQAVFVATGTGIAPFCSMARSGVSGFVLLQGVKIPEDLYYALEFRSTAERYIPCLSEMIKSTIEAFQGRVTDYLERHLKPQPYDFYLCGRLEMIRDVTLLVDVRFSDSLVYTELFY